ncbi:unnamed protein product [marine sediment metagenome]|uniref:Uncharacterized protein n=1 Tax=marine sediment metagenome TaxID=412755 RepID=X0WP39_9ZZZZ
MTIVIDINETSSGSPSGWSFNTQKFTENAFLKQIIIKPATTTTAYHLYIQDGTINSNLVFDTRTEGRKITGTLRREVNIPLVGIHTVVVTGANKNEIFKGKLVIAEGSQYV